MSLLHSLSRTKNPCKKHLVWRGNTLRCSKCNEPAGFRWLKDGKIIVYLFSAFRDMQSQIDERSDTHLITSTQDVLGEISFVEFDEFIREVHEQNMAVEMREYAETEPEPNNPDENDFDVECWSVWGTEQNEPQIDMEGGALWEDPQTQSTLADTTSWSDVMT